jgi:hypothetical protein
MTPTGIPAMFVIDGHTTARPALVGWLTGPSEPHRLALTRHQWEAGMQSWQSLLVIAEVRSYAMASWIVSSKS